jgi:putative phosphoesterase
VKIGLISDIHSNIYALRSVLSRLQGMDLILCAGDITGYYPFVNEVFEELDSHNIIYIQGNHDAYLCGDAIIDLGPIKLKSFEYTKDHITDTNLAKLKNVPLQQELSLDGFKSVMFHGSPWDKLDEYIYPDYTNFEKFKSIDADVIILGHTHYPIIKQIGGKLLINPGSCGQPRDYDPRASFAILDTSIMRARIERVQYDIEKVCASVEKLGFDKSLSAILKRNK